MTTTLEDLVVSYAGYLDIYQVPPVLNLIHPDLLPAVEGPPRAATFMHAAMRHPEWAQAFIRIIEDALDAASNLDAAADKLVELFPITMEAAG